MNYSEIYNNTLNLKLYSSSMIWWLLQPRITRETRVQVPGGLIGADSSVVGGYSASIFSLNSFNIFSITFLWIIQVKTIVFLSF